MLFHEFGEKGNPTLLLMHGMMQDWHTAYDLLKPLEERFRLIVPAMDGMYPNSPEFTTFAEQCRKIEAYVNAHYNGQLKGVYGVSQGATVLSELLARGNITVETAILDGAYVAHQGRAAAWFGYGAFQRVKKNGGKFPKTMNMVMKLMGLGEEDYEMFSAMYWDVSKESMKRNLMENYTYRANPALAHTDTKVHLWCGSKEPYAIMSHETLKQYLKNYEEVIFPDMGHGQMLLRHSDEMCGKIIETILN